ncbi:MAG: hypothetical protein GY726_16425 [Proteobacteria bacterium]|nr:hypothetical protein [Pseudomonadota bacterium]
MLEKIDSQSIPGTLIPSSTTIRKKITHGNRFLMPGYASGIRLYLGSLLSSGSRRMVISEENLIGEAKDFLDCDSLYKNSEKRLEAFSALLPNSQSITVWFFIRSLDSFLPSVYCEFLRHWRYRSFQSVLNGNYLQSWLPVIDTIRSVFSHAHLNIVNYHRYKQVLPGILADMTGISQDSLPDQHKVIRPRLSKFAVKAASLLPNHMPAYLRQRVVDSASQMSRRPGDSQSYAPFDPLLIEQLRDSYKRDIDSIRSTQGVSLLE